MRGRGCRWRWQWGTPGRIVRFLEPTLLLMLRQGPAHGYTLLGRLSRFGLEGIDPSVVYRALHDMEQQGWVTSSWDGEQTQGPPRRVYRLGPVGEEMLACWAEELELTRRRIDELLAMYYGEDSGEKKE